MTMIANYARLDERGLGLCRESEDWLRALTDGTVEGADLMEIDRACEGIIWVLNRITLPPAWRARQPAAAEGVQPPGLRCSPAMLLRGEGGTLEPKLGTGHGPVISLSVEQVKELHDFLWDIYSPQFEVHYDSKAMAADNVYPYFWKEEGKKALAHYLMPYFWKVRIFFTEAARADQQVLVFFD